MHSVPREGIAKEAIALYEMNKEFMSSKKGGPDFSALLQIPNDLTSLRNYYSQMSLIDDGVGQVLFGPLHLGPGIVQQAIAVSRWCCRSTSHSAKSRTSAASAAAPSMSTGAKGRFATTDQRDRGENELNFAPKRVIIK